MFLRDEVLYWKFSPGIFFCIFLSLVCYMWGSKTCSLFLICWLRSKFSPGIRFPGLRINLKFSVGHWVGWFNITILSRNIRILMWMLRGIWIWNWCFGIPGFISRDYVSILWQFPFWLVMGHSIFQKSPKYEYYINKISQ